MLALLSFLSTFVSRRRFLGKILIVYVSSGVIFSCTKKIESLLAFLSFTPSCNAVRYLVVNDVLITTCALLISGDFLTPTLYVGHVLLYACVSVSACSYASLAILCQGIKRCHVAYWIGDADAKYDLQFVSAPTAGELVIPIVFF